MAGRNNLTFRMRVLLMLLGSCWLLAGAFIAFQYHREKEYKRAMMDTRLQMHNNRILDDLRRGESIESIVSRIGQPADSLRVTLIDRSGNVAFDNRLTAPAANHNSRPEVIDARKYGEGHAIERVSESDATSYFYSAQLGDNGTVVRSAAPYNHSLTEFLAVDRAILWIMVAFTVASTLLAYIATRTISLSIRRLNLFAEKAEKGERIYTGYKFPHDELGNIASNIVKLYAQRDEQHREKIRLEQDKARLKRQLTNNINHELKTPVASILLSLDMLDDHPDIPQERKAELLARIRANADRLNALIRDITVITRIEDAPASIEKSPVDITSLIAELADEARMRTDMTISVDMPRLTVDGNRNLLESIFRNLIDNAIAYSGGTELHITADGDGRFDVWDNGRGIASEHLPHIFERFYRIDAGRSRNAGGTGLGLSIVRNAIAVHGGSISVQSIRGLHFRFNLPVA